MKAGIFKSPNGDLLYVAKDRSIRAYRRDVDIRLQVDGEVHETPEKLRKESRVSARNNDQQVVLVDGTLCDRISDVPNGCNDPVAAIRALVIEPFEGEKPGDVRGLIVNNVVNVLDGKQHQLVCRRQQADHSLLRHPVIRAEVIGQVTELQVANANPSDETDMRAAEFDEKKLAEGWRKCKSPKSARKHRRAGHEVFYAIESGTYYWRPRPVTAC